MKQASIIQKDIWRWNALYLLYLHEKHDGKRLYALYHLISLSYSHWFFVSLFIQNNSTNNSFFLGQQLTELTSIIKGDGAERKMEAHFLKDWFFFKPKHTGSISRRLFAIEKVQLESHSQKLGTHSTDQFPWNLKVCFSPLSLKFLFWWPGAFDSSLYKAHLNSLKQGEGRFQRRQK